MGQSYLRVTWPFKNCIPVKKLFPLITFNCIAVRVQFIKCKITPWPTLTKLLITGSLQEKRWLSCPLLFHSCCDKSTTACYALPSTKTILWISLIIGDPLPPLSQTATSRICCTNPLMRTCWCHLSDSRSCCGCRACCQWLCLDVFFINIV